ncbi:MAG: rhomboid family intramembrane serine protease [Planctomycetes bacterium]|nr:rhomboid family intramembrane serine protease [Planctomycetota bacterium]
MPRLTPAIKHLMLLNAAVFVSNILLWGRLSEPSASGGGFWFAFSWSNSLEGFGLGVLRLVTYQFTHAFRDPMHFLMNMLVLYFMGTIAEPKLGYRGAWKLYLAGGAVGGLLYLVVAALGGYQDVPLVGASGACYAFLVYAALRFPMAMVWGILPLWILAAVLVFVGLYATMIELVDGYAQGVAHSAHVGGALLGFVAFKRSWFIDWADHANVQRPSLLKGLLQGVQKKRAEARERDAHHKQLQLDEILDKVKREGLGALSAAERRFLEQMSKQARKGD